MSNISVVRQIYRSSGNYIGRQAKLSVIRLNISVVRQLYRSSEAIENKKIPALSKKIMRVGYL
ncbi:hypothetical protein [Peribacillus tepidiphilus]|uniref:hypothetical protein n=1 Tax=Peribacillus tepidiphilus TaxID=2652445 RepID=UPI001291D456|nr:hypothetical protein [Peribacillus tepidiphilus]